MEQLFSIGDVAKLFHLSVSSLRHYEALGLLTPERVDPNTGYRSYSIRQFEVLNTIRYLRALDMPLEEIYGVSTFYAQFSLNPKGQYKISVCLGTACYVKGSGKIYEKLQEKLGITGGECTPDGKFSLDACRCVGACGLAPVMTINDDVYGRLTGDELDEILAKY